MNQKKIQSKIYNLQKNTIGYEIMFLIEQNKLSSIKKKIKKKIYDPPFD